MRSSQYLISTLKETPNDAEIISHQLMLRAGMIRKLASGLYTWLPTGVKVLRKVEQIIREEMNKAGALEILMPVVQPAELWQETGRWEKYGPELLRISDRHARAFVLGPTHEEVVTTLIRNEIQSYKQLPLNLYQIQTKFRDEIRPRFGIMRSREFIMKDAYSFHLDKCSLQETYQRMHQAYCHIFERLGLNFRSVVADNGSIGGSASHEFHVLADSGEDLIAFSTVSDYAANVEMAEALPVAITHERTKQEDLEEKRFIETPNVKTIEQLITFCEKENYHVPIEKTVKTLIVKAALSTANKQKTETQHNKFIALILRGDHTLNEIKAEKHPLVLEPLTFATDEEIKILLNVTPGSIGPIDLPIPIIVDHSAALVSNFCAGANQEGKHILNLNWQRDVTIEHKFDLRFVVEGDPSPCGQGTIALKRGIEVGHIFQLGQSYSEKMGATVLAPDGKSTILEMGCYGIGVTRVVAAAIEQNYDQYGIIWPDAICPFQVVIVPMNMHKSQRLQTCCEQIYQQLVDLNIEVLFDDRKERPGVMLSDAELIGVPHLLIIGERGMDDGLLEYKNRRTNEKELISLNDIIDYLKQKLI